MDQSLANIPDSEKPREKLAEKGAGELSNVELLSIVLRTGTKGKNVKQLAGEILAEHGLHRLAERSTDELEDFTGISEVKAGQIVAVGELSRRMKREERQKIQDFEDVKAAVEDMKFLESERLRIFELSSGNELLNEREISGGVGKVSVQFSQIFSKLLNGNASAVILAHNHPSGNSEPTEQDIKFTREFMETAESLDIQLLDHVIVGRHVSSMRQCTEIFKRD